jgi:hypothetical protein
MLPPLPIPPPEVSIEVDEDQEFTVTPPFEVPSPLSPRSALTVLQAFGTGGSTEALCNVAQAASRALITRTATYEDMVRNLQEEVTRLRQQAAPTPVVPRQDHQPRHFIQNNGRLPNFIIPSRGCRAVARYVRVSPGDPSPAEGTMGVGEDIYMHPLAALPHYPDEDDPPEPLPEWFIELMHATNPYFCSLLQGCCLLEDWGLTTDVALYRATSERIQELHAAREGIDASIANCRERLDLVAFRLGSARAALRLAQFQNFASVLPTPRTPNPSAARG